MQLRSLKTITESKSRLTEEAIEPSEQIIKGVQKELKMKTGINAMLALDIKTKNAIFYSFDLSKEIRTPVLQQLFDTMTLTAVGRAIPNSVGGYAFEISINYTHPNRGSNGLELGAIFYENNKFTSKFYSKVRKSETPY